MHFEWAVLTRYPEGQGTCAWVSSHQSRSLTTDRLGSNNDCATDSIHCVSKFTMAWLTAKGLKSESRSRRKDTSSSKDKGNSKGKSKGKAKANHQHGCPSCRFRSLSCSSALVFRSEACTSLSMPKCPDCTHLFLGNVTHSLPCSSVVLERRSYEP